MAQKENAYQSMYAGNNPFNFSGGVGNKAARMFDPFGYTGWKNDPFQINYNSMPQMPFDQLIQQGMEAPDAEARLSGINADPRGLNEFRQEALRQGPSAWAHLATGQELAGEGQLREQALRDANGQSAQARSALAMRGGLDSGARERIATQGARGALDMTQQVARQGLINRTGISTQDEQNRLAQLGALPGMENQAIQPELQKQQAIISARQNDINTRNQLAMNQYTNQMQGWAAGQQAQATSKSGKK